MNEVRERIVDYIRRNRVSTTEVADCLGKTGSLPGLTAVNRGHFRAGEIQWVYAFGETNWHVHEQLQHVEEGKIIFVEAFECGDRAIFGDLVTKYLMLYKQVSGIVVDGTLRDVHRLMKENYPLWCRGFNPVGCFNLQIERTPSREVIESHREKYHGAIAVCDDTGVVIIPKSRHTPEFLEALARIEELEDTWYDCIDRLKWNTFETVCLKKYSTRE